LNPDYNSKNSENVDAEVTGYSDFNVSNIFLINRVFPNNSMHMQVIIDPQQESTGLPDKHQVL
jgi:hypothetical protein